MMFIGFSLFMIPNTLKESTPHCAKAVVNSMPPQGLNDIMWFVTLV